MCDFIIALSIEGAGKGQFRVASSFQSEAKCAAIDMEMNFYSHANKTHFHQKRFALSLVLKLGHGQFSLP